MTIGDLKRLLTELLTVIEKHDDNVELPLVNNTYFLRGAHYFLGIGGEGYLDLDNLEWDLISPNQPLVDDIEAIIAELSAHYRDSSEYEHFVVEIEQLTGLSLDIYTAEELVKELDERSQSELQQLVVDVWYRDLFF